MLEEAVRSTGGRARVARYMMDRGFSPEEWERFWPFFQEAVNTAQTPLSMIVPIWQERFPDRTVDDLFDLGKLLVQEFDNGGMRLLMAAHQVLNAE